MAFWAQPLPYAYSSLLSLIIEIYDLLAAVAIVTLFNPSLCAEYLTPLFSTPSRRLSASRHRSTSAATTSAVFYALVTLSVPVYLNAQAAKAIAYSPGNKIACAEGVERTSSTPINLEAVL